MYLDPKPWPTLAGRLLNWKSPVQPSSRDLDSPLAMFAALGIETLVCKAEALYRLASHDVGVDDFIDVGFGDVAVPDGFRIDDDVRSVLALVEAAGLVGANAALQSSFSQLLLKEFLQARFSVRIAASAGMACGPLVSAHEDVM